MTEQIVAPRLADFIEANERIRRVLDSSAGTLEAFEQNWEKRWLVERGIEIISEASRHLTDDIKERRTEIPWPKVAGIGNVLRHAYDHVAPDVLWKLAQDDLAEIEKVYVGLITATSTASAIAWWERRVIDSVATARMLWIATRRL